MNRNLSSVRAALLAVMMLFVTSNALATAGETVFPGEAPAQLHPLVAC
jgi:hypothetical protein